MDTVLQEVQSHSQAQEQKYSAVLSSVLSQLTQTTEKLEELSTSQNLTGELQLKVENIEEELGYLKETNNKTLQDYTAAMDELTDLKRSHEKTLLELSELKQAQNSTLLDYTTAIEDLVELKQSHNQSLVGLETVKCEVTSIQEDLQNLSSRFFNPDSSLHGLLQLNKPQTEVLVSEIAGRINASWYQQLSSSNHPLLNTDVGFEAYLTNATSVLPSEKIVFDKVNHNEGHGYDPASGFFTAPVSGTYLFWTHIVYKSNSSAIVFNIETNNGIIGRAYGRADEAFGTASATTLYHLMAGNRTWISPMAEVDLQAVYPSAGALLIKQY